MVVAVVAICSLAGDCGAGLLDRIDLRHDESGHVPASVLTDGPQRFSDLLPDPLDIGKVPDFDDGGPLIAQVFDEFAFEGEDDKVNVTKAALFSFLLPGAGQWYAGDKNRAGMFFATEGLGWAAYSYFETVESIKRQDYETYARANAGIDPEGKDDDFYRILSFYGSREEYNTAGRIIDPSRPYYPDVEYWDWRWQSEEHLSEYRELRNQRSEANNRGRFALGALALNRLVSAFDAWRVAKSVNRQARMELSDWKVKVKGKPFGRNPKLMLTLRREF